MDSKSQEAIKLIEHAAVQLQEAFVMLQEPWDVDVVPRDNDAGKTCVRNNCENAAHFASCAVVRLRLLMETKY